MTAITVCVGHWFAIFLIFHKIQTTQCAILTLNTVTVTVIVTYTYFKHNLNDEPQQTKDLLHPIYEVRDQPVDMLQISRTKKSGQTASYKRD